MEIKSICRCLDMIDNVIYDKRLKYMVLDNLEVIRDHIKSHRSELGDIEERVCVLSVFGQINKIIELFYSNDNEERLKDEYNKLRQRVLTWYEMINKVENNFISKKLDLIKEIYN